MRNDERDERVESFRRIDLRVACPSCGDETLWHVDFDELELPASFRVADRTSTFTCDHWRDVHELAFQESFKHRCRRPVTVD
jgi:hypothetical protein